MTAIYQGNEQWELFFEYNKRVVLSTHEIRELVEQSEDILYSDDTYELFKEKDEDGKILPQHEE